MTTATLKKDDPIIYSFVKGKDSDNPTIVEVKGIFVKTLRPRIGEIAQRCQVILEGNSRIQTVLLRDVSLDISFHEYLSRQELPESAKNLHLYLTSQTISYADKILKNGNMDNPRNISAD